MTKNSILFAFILTAIFFTWSSNSFAQKKTQIKILGADEGKYEEEKYGKAKILTGNVRFKQGKTLMYCDSAVLYSTENSMKAFGHIKIIDKDQKTEMTGDSLIFDGNENKGKLRGSINFKNEDQVLVTRNLDFNTKSNQVHYFGGGTITNNSDKSVLKSKIGYYQADLKRYFFKDTVSYVTEEYRMYSDTMQYNTEEEVVYFYGPTNIYSDSNSIYCESGWYDKINRLSTFSKNVEMISSEQTLNTDSLVYNEQFKIGEAFGQVAILDTTNKIEIRGDYAKYNNIKRTSLCSGSLELILFFSDDTLYLHSDTLFSNYDSTNTHRIIQAFHHVQFYKPDLQGKCDSLSFSESDSTMRMYINPIVWSDSNQITGEEIIIKTYDGVIQNMQINNEAFIISEEEQDLYNQIKGKSLFAHFKNNEIHKIDVNRSAQTIYFVRNESQKLMGMNRLDCSSMSLFIDSLGIDHINFFNQPDGTFYPMKDLVSDELKFLRFFYWRIDERPQTVNDIFIWKEVPDQVKRRREVKK